MSADYRDILIEGLADDLVAAEARIVSLIADTDSYRALGQQALHALAAVTQQRDQLRERIRRLADENRELRGELMRADSRAA